MAQSNINTVSMRDQENAFKGVFIGVFRLDAVRASIWGSFQEKGYFFKMLQNPAVRAGIRI